MIGLSRWSSGMPRSFYCIRHCTIVWGLVIVRLSNQSTESSLFKIPLRIRVARESTSLRLTHTIHKPWFLIRDQCYCGQNEVYGIDYANLLPWNICYDRIGRIVRNLSGQDVVLYWYDWFHENRPSSQVFCLRTDCRYWVGSYARPSFMVCLVVKLSDIPFHFLVLAFLHTAYTMPIKIFNPNLLSSHLVNYFIA